MRLGQRPACSLLGLVLILLVLPATPRNARATEGGGEASNEARLRSMPREERLALLEKLKAFDALSGAEQSAIRGIDARTAADRLRLAARVHEPGGFAALQTLWPDLAGRFPGEPGCDPRVDGRQSLPRPRE